MVAGPFGGDSDGGWLVLAKGKESKTKGDAQGKGKSVRKGYGKNFGYVENQACGSDD